MHNSDLCVSQALHLEIKQHIQQYALYSSASLENNEIFLFSQNRPFRFAHTQEGWTAEAVLDRVIPAFQSDFFPLERSGDIFSWDPI